MESKLLTGIQALVDIQDEWNALWLRADVTYPGSRAENIAIWMQQFEPDRELKLVTAWEQERLVAALPLYDKAQTGDGGLVVDLQLLGRCRRSAA